MGGLLSFLSVVLSAMTQTLNPEPETCGHRWTVTHAAEQRGSVGCF
jgi:hypothetical protein